MPNKLQNEWRSPIIFALLIIMMGALFFSRAVLSIGMLVFVTFSFFHTDIKKQFADFFSSPLLWSMSLLFFIPLMSGVWSDDKKEWAGMIRIKLPLLFFPIAFASPFYFTKKQWDWLAYFFIVIITGATCWCMFFYLLNVNEINNSYLQAKTIITPLQNDHVRFSWLVSAAILLSVYFYFIIKRENKFISYLLIIAAVWLILFLHILAVRTGLFSFYIMLAGATVYFIYKKIHIKYSVVLIIGMIAFPFIAYKTIPTFQNRAKYILYDKGYFEKAHYLPGATDAVRIISIKAGWNVMNEHPATGVGFGDVLIKTKNWYGKNYPEMIESDKIYPGSEWMMYGAGAGWPGFLLFSFIMIIPFLVKIKSKLPWYLLNATTAFSFMFDIGLEVQFGVFIYSFIILWCYKWLNAEKM